MRYPDVVSEEATLQKALRGKSLARFGDGEVKIMLGRSIKFQKHDKRLQAMLRECVRDWAGPCLPCIPRIAHSKRPKWEFWEKYTRDEVVRLYDTRQRATYGSAFISRPDSAHPSIDTAEYWALLESLWKGGDIVLVRGSLKSLASDLLGSASSLEEVLAPREDAFAEFDALFERLKGEKRRVLLCLGPTATVLAWKLAGEGVHALDLGHVGMFMRKAQNGQHGTGVRGEPDL